MKVLLLVIVKKIIGFNEFSITFTVSFSHKICKLCYERRESTKNESHSGDVYSRGYAGILKSSSTFPTTGEKHK
ncbi:hypothetical protein EDD57_102105 [Baia soyae]|uniref:Uncharacterized protein n=1 Tax=Baia soyae TaxID=1544746 RepID=A0A4R2S2C0_9BACL|nr:hypothetical protein EDD57_102105 [Baia soyae]